MNARRVISIGIATCLLAGFAFAGEEANAPTVTGETGLFTLFTGRTLPAQGWSFGAYYNNWDRVFKNAGDSDADWHRLSASVGYGITDNFELSVMLPWEKYHFGWDRSVVGPGEDTDVSGLGSARVGAKWMISGDDAGAFALNAFVELPTGDKDVGADDTGYGLGADWSRGNWVFDVGYHQPGDVDGNSRSDAITGGLGYAGRVSDSLDWITELAGRFPLDSDTAVFDDSVDFTTGGRYWFGENSNWAFNFAVRTDLLQLDQTDQHCPIGGLIGLTYFPFAAFRTPPPPPEMPAVPVDYQLSVSTAGDCSGTVTSSPAGIDCGSDCDEVYAEGTVVNLTATPDEGCRFAGWSGDADCSDGSVTMDGSRMCVATFNAIPAPPPPPAAPQKREVERVCQFSGGSARVDNACKAILDEVALLMKDQSDATTLVIGYTDSQGSQTTNQRMSERRAEAIKNWLVTRHGIDPSRITTEGRGSAEPAAPNTTAAGRAKNRRAVIRVTITEG